MITTLGDLKKLYHKEPWDSINEIWHNDLKIYRKNSVTVFAFLILRKNVLYSDLEEMNW